MSHPTRQHSLAFTLVELLVVIGIIAILVAVLLPALNRARQQANLVKCQANLRSIGQAIAIYAAQNNGTLPPGEDTGDPQFQDPAHAFRWPALLLHTLMPKYGFTWNDSATTGADVSKVREMFFCPEVPGDHGRLNQTGLSHYFCHPRLMPAIGKNDPKQRDGGGGGGPFGAPSHAPHLYKMGKVKRASEIAIIFEGALQYNTSTGEYNVGYDDPVAINLDKHSYVDGPTYLTDTNYTSTITADDSVDMTPTWKSPAKDWVNKDGYTFNGDTSGSGYNNFQNIRFRHKNNTVMNALMVDGHVESFTYNPKLAATPNAKNITTLKRKNINVSP